MPYSNFKENLLRQAEPAFAAFQKRLIFTKYEILGVRTPTLRKLTKAWKGREEELLAFPNENYETVFIKLAAVAALPYEQFLQKLEYCVSLMDNWALCDCFKVKCIAKHKQEFLTEIEKIFQTGKEFYQRYALVVLLSDYVEEEYLPTVREYLRRADTRPYYIHMAAAWLTAEILIKHYEYGVALLTYLILVPKTHNKAVQKAIESYRLTTEQKEFLRSLKIN